MQNGAMTWLNLIVATAHNNLAIGQSVQQVSEHFIDGNKLKEGMVNRVSAVARIRSVVELLHAREWLVGDENLPAGL